MRPVAWVLAASLGLAGVAHATQDHYDDIAWIAAWPDQEAFVVERVSYSPEAEGKDLRTWWVIEKPAGEPQAVIYDPYDKKPWVSRPKKSTIPKDKLDALVAGLQGANRAKPRPRPAAVRDTIAPTLGLTGLASAPTCPVKVKIGKKTITVTAGTVTVDAGPSIVRVDRTMEMDMTYDTVGESSVDRRPKMRPTCFVHPAGLVAKISLHVAYEGDNYSQRIAFLPGVTLP
jgi:hypothetical protein